MSNTLSVYMHTENIILFQKSHLLVKKPTRSGPAYTGVEVGDKEHMLYLY